MGAALEAFVGAPFVLAVLDLAASDALVGAGEAAGAFLDCAATAG